MPLRPRPLLLLLAFVVSGPAAACGPFFYAAAPALTPDEMSVAVRTLASLHDLSMVRRYSRAETDALAGELMDAAAAALTTPGEDTGAALQVLQQRNRDGAYRAATANFLADLEDLVRARVPADMVAGYVAWRRGLVPGDEGIATEQPRNVPLKVQPWMSAQQQQEISVRAERLAQEKAARRAEAEQLVASAPPPLVPFYEVQMAARDFRRHEFAAALERFERVAREHPGHPRAETAAFMAWRCRIEIARDAARAAGPGESRDEINAARSAGHAFRTQFPQTRYAAELAGWEGALHVIAGEDAAAFVSYADQAEHAGQPAVVRQALLEAERCLLRLSSNGARELPHVADALMTRPRAALRMVYFVLEPAATVDYSQWPWMQDRYQWQGGIQERDRMARRWRIRGDGRQFLRELARSLRDRQGAERVAEWDPFSLAVVIWQATEDGDHHGALALCRRYPGLVEKSDDLQVVRAIALQRAGRAEDAIAAWHAVRRQFPDSPLAAQARQRLVALLTDARRPAEALVLILEREAAIREAAGGAVGGAVSTATLPGEAVPLLEDDLRQWRDVLALMATPEELEKEWGRATVRSVKSRLGAMLLAHRLSAGELEKARPLMQGAEPFEESAAHPDEAGLPLPLPASASAWEQWFQPLADAHRRAAGLRGAKAAAAWLDAGKRWAALRRQFVMHAARADYMGSEFREVEFRVRQNAVALGWPADRVNEALLRQDFLVPAMMCWERAAKAAPASEAAAEALALGLDALVQRAELNPMAMEAAAECGWSELSEALATKLRRHPAPGRWRGAAVPIDFSRGVWLPGNGKPAAVTAEVVAVLTGDPVNDEPEPENAFDPRTRLMLALDGGGRAAAFALLPQLREEARSRIRGTGCESLNEVESLAAALGKKDVSDDDLRAWWDAEASGRHAEHPDPAFADLRDYHEVRRAAVIRPFETGREPGVIAMWREYSMRYPDTPRREAAAFQLTRAICRAARGPARFENASWAQGGPLPSSRYLVIVTRRAAVPPSAADVRKALTDFSAEWPESRYAADVRLLRGSAAIDEGDYGLAIDLLLPLTGDPAHRELHSPAALHLADVFLRLLDVSQRPAIASALKDRPEARERLRRFMASRTPGGRLAIFRQLAE